MAVCGENKTDIEPFAFSIPLGLIKAVTGMEGLPFSLNERQSNRLRINIYFDPKDIINFAL
jgi:hypothetical protein